MNRSEAALTGAIIYGLSGFKEYGVDVNNHAYLCKINKRG